ncbi:MAG: hypothetical protein J7K58_00340 [Euryarchaeota archaeon]|nr:hypothetical protein [Euryarchaeota archaeon]
MITCWDLLIGAGSDRPFKPRFSVKYIKEKRQSFNWVMDMAELAKHAGRVTVKEEDIKLAAEELR